MDIKKEPFDELLSSENIFPSDYCHNNLNEGLWTEFGGNATVKVEAIGGEAMKEKCSTDLSNVKQEEEEDFSWRSPDTKPLKTEKLESGECSSAEWSLDKNTYHASTQRNFINSTWDEGISTDFSDVKKEGFVDDNRHEEKVFIEIPVADNSASLTHPLLNNSLRKPPVSFEDIQFEENDVKKEIIAYQPVIVVISLEKKRFFDQNFVCSHCFTVFSSNLSLGSHEVIHNNSKLISKTDQSGKNSRTKAPCKLTSTKKCFKCDVCEFQSEYKCSLKIHKLIHSGIKPYECDQCNYKSARPSILKTHKLSHTGERPFKCDQCSYKSAHKHKLKLHKMTHSGEKPFECDVCDYKSSQRSTLLTHKLSHTTEKPFKCDSCNYTCKLESYLKKHTRLSHSGVKLFKCDLCDYKSECRSTFEAHKEWHTERGSFNCEFCDYMSSRKYHLKRHQMTHSGERPFECDICDYKSVERSTLNKHMLSHSGEKPFKCDECKFTTAYKSNMKKHRMKHSSDKKVELNPA